MENLNILSINGGGIRGLIALKQLVRLEEICGMKLNEKFKFISGTSTGGIIAVLLADGKSAQELLDLYIQHSSKIFKKRFLRFGIFGSKYSSVYFEKLIHNYVGDRKLSDIKIDVTIPVCNETVGELVFFKSRKAREDSAYDFLLKDVIRSSASVPYLFKPHEICGEYYVDGGVVISNPSLITSTEAEKFARYDKTNIRINCFSISTGPVDDPFTKEVILVGLFKKARRTLDMLLKNQDKITDYFLCQHFENTKGVYMRCDSFINKSDGSINNVSPNNILNMFTDGDMSSFRNRTMMIKFHVETLNKRD